MGWETLSDAAERLRVTEKTLRRWIATGRLPAYRLGPRAIRLLTSDVDDLLRRITTTGGDAA